MSMCGGDEPMPGSDAATDAPTALVQISDGAVRGHREDSLYSSPFYSFWRIPYARPPLGALRFRPPVPILPWQGELDATQQGPDLLDRSVSWYWSTEDCLYLNVHTKNLNRKEKLPVMVWLGSFGFSLTFSSILGPGLLTDEDVIIVNCGYRLGPFGFLSLCEENAPGNCGLKDVVMALKWIRNNIAAFGGDPDNITIFGSGSGAAVVHFMMLSPMATGLFHKAISQSGCALNNWAVCRNPVNSTMVLARQLGITCRDPNEVVDILRNMPEIEILEVFRSNVIKLTQEEGIPFCLSWFRPCIENEFEGQSAFITKHPRAILKSGIINKVPFIIGSNKMEGLSFKMFIKEPRSKYDLYNKNAHLLVPKELRVDDEGKFSTSQSIGQRLMQFYVQDDKITEETSDQYCQFLTDYYFLYYINSCVKRHIQCSKEYPVYYYVFDYNGDWSFPQDLQVYNAPTHGGELPYLFQFRSDKYTGSRDSKRTRQRVIKLWTNFAKFGNPTPNETDSLLQITWNPVTDKDKLNYLNIGSELTQGRNPFFERMAFWDNLLDETTHLRICAFFDNSDPIY